MKRGRHAARTGPKEGSSVNTCGTTLHDVIFNSVTAEVTFETVTSLLSKHNKALASPSFFLNKSSKTMMQATMGQNQGVESRVEDIIMTEPSPFDFLPEDCISKIISFTSPRDACVAASVSKTFESAVKSDIVWEKFLPPEYSSLIPRSRAFSSKKELYFALCDDPVLIEEGKKVYIIR